MSRASRWLLGEEKFNSGSETLSVSFLFLINWKVSQFQIRVYTKDDIQRAIKYLTQKCFFSLEFKFNPFAGMLQHVS